MLDDDLVNRAKRITKISSTSEVLEHVLRESLRRDSLRQLAAALRTPSEKHEGATAAPRRRPA